MSWGSLRRHRGALVAGLAYLAGSLFATARLWAGGLGHVSLTPQGDPALYTWTIGWVAHAIAGLEGPWWSPNLAHAFGFNTLANPGAPGVGLAMAPITWALGAQVATNLALTLAPVASGLAMYAALRRWVAWTPAAVVAGGLWAFSPFAFYAQGAGWLNLCVLVTPPLMLLVLNDLVAQRGSRFAGAAKLAALALLQLLVSGEVLLVEVVVIAIGVAGLLAAAGLFARERLLAEWRGVGTNLGLAALAGLLVLVGPVLFALLGPGHLDSPVWDRWNFATSPQPLPADYLSPQTYGPRFGFFQTLSTHLPNRALFGAGLLLVALGGGLWLWRRGIAALGLLVFAASAWLAAGYHAWLGPWPMLSGLPVFNSAYPDRFELGCWFALSLLLAVVLDAGKQRLAGRLAPLASAGIAGLLALLAVAQPLAADLASAPFPAHRTPRSAFLAKHHEQLRGHVLLTFPYPSASGLPMLQQSQLGYGYRLVGVWGPARQRYEGQERVADQLLTQLEAKPVYGTFIPSHAQMLALRSAIKSWGVQDVVVGRSGGPMSPRWGASPAQTVLAYTELLGPPRYVDGSWYWEVPEVLPPMVELGRDDYIECVLGGEGADHLGVARCVAQRAR